MRKITLENATIDELRGIIGPHVAKAKASVSESRFCQLEEESDLIYLNDALPTCQNAKELQAIKQQYACTIKLLIEQQNNARATPIPTPQRLPSNNSFTFFLGSPPGLSCSTSAGSPTPIAPASATSDLFEFEQ